MGQIFWKLFSDINKIHKKWCHVFVAMTTCKHHYAWNHHRNELTLYIMYTVHILLHIYQQYFISNAWIVKVHYCCICLISINHFHLASTIIQLHLYKVFITHPLLAKISLLVSCQPNQQGYHPTTNNTKQPIKNNHKQKQRIKHTTPAKMSPYHIHSIRYFIYTINTYLHYTTVINSTNMRWYVRDQIFMRQISWMYKYDTLTDHFYLGHQLILQIKYY